jgi:lysophospholipase L1-like esterase
VGHVVLLGDSVFDNAAYVAGGPDVVSQLRGVLPAGWRATLQAVDGSVTASVARQLEWLPGDATHLVVSVGGNDALQASDILTAGAASTAEAFLKLAAVKDQFEFNYSRMLGQVLARRLPTAVCTIYYPRFPDAALQRLAVTALASFNDCIIRAAFAAGLPLLDLRLICSDDADYANPIEPSARGGEKIAAAIRTMLAAHDFTRRRTEVFV